MKLKKLCEKLKSFFLLAIFLFLSASAMAQLYFDDNHTMLTPDAWRFMRYGNNSVNLYTGTIQVSIPIYTYEDNDFVIPVSLDYSSNGFIPNMPTGSVGLGWLLNAGGMITREIRGIADEYSTKYDSRYPGADYITGSEYKHYPQSFLNGYYSYHLKMCESNPDTRFKSICELTDGVYNTGLHHPIEIVGDTYNKMSEVSPDIFSFNYMGHKGKFSMFEGDIYVYDTNTPQGEYQIDLSGLRNTCSEIKIITGDGYKYTFGGLDDRDSIKITGRFTPFYKNTSYDPFMTDQINSAYTCWLLTSIEAPNGRKVIFRYSEARDIQRTFPGGTHAFSSTTTTIKIDKWFYKYEGSRTQTSNTVLGIINYSYKERQLTQIDIGNGLTIDFSYHPTESEQSVNVQKIYLDDLLYSFDKPKFNKTTVSRKISTIKVNSKFEGGTHEIKSATLNYRNTKDYNTGTIGYKHQLHSVSISGEGRYYMTYHGFDYILPTQPRDYSYEIPYEYTDGHGAYAGIPANGTSALDYWGFFNGRINGSWYNLNGRPNNADLITQTKQYLNIQSRMPDYDSALVGMLKRLVYPTGGTTCFEYESNDASKYVQRGSGLGSGCYMLAPYSLASNSNNTSNSVGGVRIKKISDYDSGSIYTSMPKRTREFFYETEAGSSSGIVLYFPVQTMYYEQKHKKTDVYQYCRSWSPYHLTTNTNSSHIGYSRVVEKNSDNSYIEYKLTDYVDFPDDVTSYNESPSDLWTLVGQTPSDLIRFLKTPISHEINRGRLKSKTFYSADKRPVYSEYYSFDVSRPLDYLSDVRHAIATVYEHRILTEQYPLYKKEIINHLPNGDIKATYTYEYNLLGQKIKEEAFHGPHEGYYTTYTYYAHETNQAMKKRNLMSAPRQIVNTVKKHDSSVETVTEDVKYSYSTYLNANNASLHKISKIEKAYTSVHPSKYYTYVTYNNYDMYGNLLEYTDQNGIKTSYIWGYRGLYPVASAENTSRQQLQNKLGTSLVSRSPIESCLSESQINAIKTIPDSFITTYTYQPFIGIRTVTDPSGHKMEYEYYQDGKLKQVKDDKGNIINEYEYHFKRN